MKPIEIKLLFFLNLRKLWFREICPHNPLPLLLISILNTNPSARKRSQCESFFTSVTVMHIYSSWNHIINALNWINLWHFPWLNDSNNMQSVRIHETDRKSGCVTVKAIFNSCRKCFLAQTWLYLAQTHSHTFNRWDKQEPDTFLTVPSWI